MLYLTITLYNDETFGIFRQEPPLGVLPEIKEISMGKPLPLASWELEKQWEETLNDLPAEMKHVMKFFSFFEREREIHFFTERK